MNVEHSILENNGYNKQIKFSINGVIFKAAFTEGKPLIEDFCRELSYDEANQETDRLFFTSLSQVIEYAKKPIK